MSSLQHSEQKMEAEAREEAFVLSRSEKLIYRTQALTKEDRLTLRKMEEEDIHDVIRRIDGKKDSEEYKRLEAIRHFQRALVAKTENRAGDVFREFTRLHEKSFELRIPNWFTKHCSFCAPREIRDGIWTTWGYRFEHPKLHKLDAHVWHYERALTILYWRSSMILLPETDFAKEYKLSHTKLDYYTNKKYRDEYNVRRFLDKLSKIVEKNRSNQSVASETPSNVVVRSERSNFTFRGNDAASWTEYSSPASCASLFI